MGASATLAIDLGGTKTLACLVETGQVTGTRIGPTLRTESPDQWLQAIADMAADWRGRFDRAGIAVTGVVEDGCWSALNPGILPVPDGFPLADRLQALLGVSVCAANDAQAAAWGEFRYGAGSGSRTMLFATISTGLGGGVICDGRLLTGRSGVAGSFGQLNADLLDGARLEERVSGQWIARRAAEVGHPGTAADVMAAAAGGADWAEDIVATSAARAAGLLANLQLLFDPDCIVIGGGVGLATGYLNRLEDAIGNAPRHRKPRLVPAALGAHAGVVGVADLADNRIQKDSQTEEVGRC